MRQVHKSTDRLSPEAVRVMTDGFRLRKTYAAIAQELSEIGEEVPERTIARRAVEWRREQARRAAARDQVHDLVAAMKANDLSAAEMIQALAMQALMDDPAAFAEKDPLKVQFQALMAEDVRLKKRKQELAERKLALDEAKYKAQREREERAKAATDEAAAKAARGEKLSIDDLNRIREIYGMKPVEARA